MYFHTVLRIQSVTYNAASARWCSDIGMGVCEWEGGGGEGGHCVNIQVGLMRPREGPRQCSLGTRREPAEAARLGRWR
jgi:hypothetical protein